MARKRRRRLNRKRRRKRGVRTNLQNKLNATVLPSPYANNSLLKKSIRVNFRYVERFSLNPGIASLATYRFSANGMWNPTSALGDHKPRGYDQLMLLYDHYTVISSKLTVTTGGTPGQNPSIFGIALKDTDTEHIATDYLEDYTSNNIFGVNTEANPHTLSMNFSSKRFLGPGIFNDDRKGGVASNPNEQAHFHVYSFPIDTGSDAGLKWYLGVVDYIAILTEPINPAEL